MGWGRGPDATLHPGLGGGAERETCLRLVHRPSRGDRRKHPCNVHTQGTRACRHTSTPAACKTRRLTRVCKHTQTHTCVHVDTWSTSAHVCRHSRTRAFKHTHERTHTNHTLCTHVCTQDKHARMQTCARARTMDAHVDAWAHTFPAHPYRHTCAHTHICRRTITPTHTGTSAHACRHVCTHGHICTSVSVLCCLSLLPLDLSFCRESFTQCQPVAAQAHCACRRVTSVQTGDECADG